MNISAWELIPPTAVRPRMTPNSRPSHMHNTFTPSQYPPNSQSPAASTLSPKICSKYHRLKSPSSYHLNQVWMRLWV